MRKILLATAAVALALTIPAVGNALSLSVGAGVSGNGSASGSGVSLGGAANVNAAAQANAGGGGIGGATSSDDTATAAANGDISDSTVLAAFNADGDRTAIQAVGSLGADSKVEVVKIGSIVSANADAFNPAITNSAATSAQLQAAINANADLSAQLGQNNIDVSSIVAGDVETDGTLVLYSNS